MAKYKKMPYFSFLSLDSSEMTGNFSLTLREDKSKIVTKAYWEDGVIFGGFKDYMAWEYFLSDIPSLLSDIPKLRPNTPRYKIVKNTYELNPIIQAGFYDKGGILEGELIDFEYKK